MVKITRQELQFYRNFYRLQNKTADREDHWVLATYVLMKVFGTEWFQKNIFPSDEIRSAKTEKAFDSKLKAFDPNFNPNFIPKPQKSGNGEWVYDPTHLHRVIILADMIFNLQDVSGIDNVLDKMRTHSIEPYYAELVAGKMLRLHDTPFEYRVEGQGRGQDYDADILLQDGQMLACEMKCKAQTTGFSTAALDSTLSHARKQLPPGKPGVIFMEIPQWWPGGFDVIPPSQLGGFEMVQMWSATEGETFHGIEVDGWSATGDVISPSIHKFFRSSRRVAYVVVYTDARYDAQSYSPNYFWHLKKMYGFPEDAELVYAVVSKVYKNPNAICSADLPESILQKNATGSSWLKLSDV